MDVKRFTPLRLLLLFPLVCGLLHLPSQLQLSSAKFKVYQDKKTWAEAQSYCQEHHVDLFRITSLLEYMNIRRVSGWTGLHREEVGGEWKWSGSDQTPARKTFGVISEATLENLEGSCAFWDGLDLRGDNCSEKRAFICLEEKLVLVRDNKTWEEASDHCRSLEGPDVMDLVSRFDDDPDFVWQTAIEATTDEVWIGLRFLAGYWWWATGEVVKNSTFKSCPTDGACAVLEKNSKAFGIRSCLERRNFLCGRRP